MTSREIACFKRRQARHAQQIARGRKPGQLGRSRIITGDPAADAEREARRQRQRRWYWNHRDEAGFLTARNKGHAHV